jgi:hypothetical protein
MPLILYKMIHEMNTAACPALTSYIKLTSGAANPIILFGPDEDRPLPAEDAQRRLAGDHVPDRAERRLRWATSPPGPFPPTIRASTGSKRTKMFITAGDAGICANTIHMVLARPEGGAPGSPGIGLYIVPQIRVNGDGSLGPSNDVTTVSLEHKMGLNAQATALLNFGDNDACYGIRMGPPPTRRDVRGGLL